VILAEAVAELSHKALSADEPEELLRESLQIAIDATGADYGTAVRRMPDGAIRVAHEVGPQPLPTGTTLPLAEERSYVSRVLETGRPFVSADLRHDPRVAPPQPLLSRGIVSSLAVPVRGAENVMGALGLHSRHHRRFTRDDVAVACALASVVATAWEQAAQRERLRHQALHDPLTGLPNRTLFLDRLNQILTRRPGSDAGDPDGVAVMLIDLDHFKEVNDHFGHAAGDHLLRAVGQRLATVVRPHDTLARLGGDEFALICEPVKDEASAVRLARRMQDVCRPPVDFGSNHISVSASYGMTWSPQGCSPGCSAEGLLGEADAALYRAKSAGSGQIRVFDDRMERSTRRRRQVEADLQVALDRDQFRMHYQPVRRSDDLAVVGVEALVRWQHPTKGLLLPGEFIPIVEQSGLLGDFGEWVLRMSCREVARWQDSTLEPLWLAVNLSPRQLNDPLLPETVADAQREAGLQEGTLVLELTESALMMSEGAHLDALTLLRKTGARLFLDDFGTGYSSLTHLTHLPIQAVKIDRSFVAGLPVNRRNAAVVSSLITLSEELGLTLIAEGVETSEQLRTLRTMGCQAVQGFLLDRPAANPDLERSRLERLSASGAGVAPSAGR
jgi:diguanylate cyclase (GGDEF)-like protein